MTLDFKDTGIGLKAMHTNNIETVRTYIYISEYKWSISANKPKVKICLVLVLILLNVYKGNTTLDTLANLFACNLCEE